MNANINQQPVEDAGHDPLETTIGLRSVTETCTLLRIGRTSLHHLTKRGEIVPTRIGGRILYAADEIKRFAELCRAVPGQPLAVPAAQPTRTSTAPGRSGAMTPRARSTGKQRG